MCSRGLFNTTLGAIAIAAGLGAWLSIIFSGTIVQRSGYTTAHLGLTGITLTAFAILWCWVPETKQ